MKTALLFLFHYNCGTDEHAAPSGMALFARNPDYHGTVSAQLRKMADHLQVQYPSAKFACYVDASPIYEVAAAEICGLGVRGKHNLLIHPVYGSFHHIGAIVTDLEIEQNRPAAISAALCDNCDKCINACPVNALKDGFDRAKCLSNMAQKKGALSGEEQRLIKQYGVVWGCDRCQVVCPYNQAVMVASPSPSWDGRIDIKELEQMDDHAFTRKYGGTVFAYRGRETILRNLRLARD